LYLTSTKIHNITNQVYPPVILRVQPHISKYTCSVIGFVSLTFNFSFQMIKNMLKINDIVEIYACSNSSSLVTFPEITICPRFLQAYKSNKLSQYGLSVDDIRKRIIFPKGLPQNKSLANFFEEVTHGLDEILDSIIVTTNFKQEGTHFTTFMFSNDENLTGK